MREDLSVFFGDFADDVLRSTGATFKGIVDSTFVGVGDVAAVESAAISLFARSSDVSDIVHGDVLEINDTDYVVTGKEPDGTGVTVLRLERQ